MFIIQRKQSQVFNSKKDRSFGFIRLGNSASLEKYFLMAKYIRSVTAESSVGDTVFFDLSALPSRKDGEVRMAINADIQIESASVTEGGAL
jgi:hypothetical protein